MRKLLTTLGAVAAALPSAVLAASNPDPGIIQTCVVPGISCLGGDLASYIDSTILDGARTAFTGLLFGAILYYGIKLLMTPESDNAVTETRQALEYALFGVILMLGAQLIASSFVTGGVVQPAGVNTVLETVITFIKAIIAVALLVNITIQGFRMITATEEGGVTKARTRFLHGVYGAAIVLLASPIVHMMYGKSPSAGEIELIGIANYIITIFGLLAVVALIVAGILLIVSVDESFKDRAKKLATASLIAIVVVVSAGALVNFFIIRP
ncbi:MAG TPA: hypothetical protein DEB30_04975 [Candidatus Peribacter riflensis]|uniref:Uncharacterized protein n=1 Tax=Candidatus Peribacter riflensis TaxID=1735162 RepID=A0A0S1SIH5_9BACT|nr:MAG: hypothetical protein PeribacterA2_0227 [Candidatus Peribacter riflensis]OGJ77297.1 MAG: hypothetical protein A2398_03930 [Candidatus Peribacteria bacterium RIFOXYB1_FULL_57_12]OGJ81996.1 MAG: hypothetical protein A2412_00880 [Candidatus Peribacteria bacterium RIFOXYC1_FULL_58_8]ALM10721.1 MAG: hypothetical protein PeribacterB2_0227 [Candidatus Peribacter riflensis]ALM11823.1 MAG: hypothetical protein PeribacterC2_0226 [Candidatus Peribacter riflensis]